MCGGDRYDLGSSWGADPYRFDINLLYRQQTDVRNNPYALGIYNSIIAITNKSGQRNKILRPFLSANLKNITYSDNFSLVMRY